MWQRHTNKQINKKLTVATPRVLTLVYKLGESLVWEGAGKGQLLTVKKKHVF